MPRPLPLRRYDGENPIARVALCRWVAPFLEMSCQRRPPGEFPLSGTSLRARARSASLEGLTPQTQRGPAPAPAPAPAEEGTPDGIG